MFAFFYIKSNNYGSEIRLLNLKESQKSEVVRMRFLRALLRHIRLSH
jgi:hypothetical protein